MHSASIPVTETQGHMSGREGASDRATPVISRVSPPVGVGGLAPTLLVAGVREALGRDLSLDEVRRIVDAGPMAGRPLSDPDVTEWLLLLDFKYVRPPADQSAWSVFVEEHIDSVLMSRSWDTIPDGAIHDICEIIDDVAGDSLSRLGWAWTVADSDSIDSYDVSEVLADPYGCGFNPVVADGIPGFIFRATSREDAIARHTKIDRRNDEALEMVSGVSLLDVVSQPHHVDFALKLFANP